MVATLALNLRVIGTNTFLPNIKGDDGALGMQYYQIEEHSKVLTE